MQIVRSKPWPWLPDTPTPALFGCRNKGSGLRMWVGSHSARSPAALDGVQRHARLLGHARASGLGNRSMMCCGASGLACGVSGSLEAWMNVLCPHSAPSSPLNSALNTGKGAYSLAGAEPRRHVGYAPSFPFPPECPFCTSRSAPSRRVACYSGCHGCLDSQW